MGRKLTHLQYLAVLLLASVGVSAQATPSTSYYIYDESGHVIGEYDANGNPVQEHIYLGDRPVAVVQGGNAAAMNYVTTDQLNTPRAITDASQTLEWSWASDPFGNGQPTGSLTYNLRFPGQYYDAETGHNYNTFRDYDSGTGRYIESDPIGIRGGSNTYAYVFDNPASLSDWSGLYTSGWHSAFTSQGAQSAGMSSAEAASLAAAVAAVDNGSQGEYEAYMHAMCPGGLSGSECQEWFFGYVKAELAKCTQQGLADALHAVQDSFAAGHRGFHTYYGFWYFYLNPFAGVSHYLGDEYPSAEEQQLVSSVTADIVRQWKQRCDKCGVKK